MLLLTRLCAASKNGDASKQVILQTQSVQPRSFFGACTVVVCVIKKCQ